MNWRMDISEYAESKDSKMTLQGSKDPQGALSLYVVSAKKPYNQWFFCK